LFIVLFQVVYACLGGFFIDPLQLVAIRIAIANPED
jgi:hypothetical protein